MSQVAFEMQKLIAHNKIGFKKEVIKKMLESSGEEQVHLYNVAGNATKAIDKDGNGSLPGYWEFHGLFMAQLSPASVTALERKDKPSVMKSARCIMEASFASLLSSAMSGGNSVKFQAAVYAKVDKESPTGYVIVADGGRESKDDETAVLGALGTLPNAAEVQLIADETEREHLKEQADGKEDEKTAAKKRGNKKS